MTKQSLTQQFVETATCPAGKQKADYFDTKLSGFLLKVSPSGKRSYYIRYKDAHERKKEKRLLDASQVNLQDARQHAQHILSRLALGEDPFAEQQSKRQVPTLKAFVHDSYLPHLQTLKKSWKVDEAQLRLHVLPHIGSMYLDDITKKHMIELMTAHSREYKPASTNRLYNVIHRLFNCAIEWEVPGVTRNPVSAVAKRKENNQRDRYLSEQELRALWKAIEQSDSVMLPYIVKMLVFTGARKTEVAQAKWDDIDWQLCQWRIPENKSGKVRYVPLSGEAIKMLKSIEHFSGCPFIFPNPKTMKPYVNFFHSWNTARIEAGVPDVRIHDLRHTCASYLVNQGSSIYEVKQILGHANVTTTQRYAHLMHSTLLRASNGVGHYIKETTSTLGIEVDGDWSIEEVA